MTMLSDQVFEIVKSIPKGKVTTYKVIADKLGVRCYRAIGQLLKNNSNAPIIPCHRVVKNDGSLGGYFGTKTEDKIKLLQSEGILVKDNKIVDFKTAFHRG